MKILDIITKKRDKQELSEEEIKYVINDYVAGIIPDYQMSALLMAIYLNGMTALETAYLTKYMALSGENLDLSGVDGITIDKHSTGGVGDKTTLIICPIVAALGLKVAKFTGRSLGFTGGTLDKLESIPGFQTELSKEQILKQLNEIGICIAGPTNDIAPADKKIYQLRNFTSTIDSIALGASSIMSKKLAVGASNIVLDVKTGSGAFMAEEKRAIELAESMVAIGKLSNLGIRALITDMSVPLGDNIGNYLEVKEAIEVLKNNGPGDLTYLCVELASHMVSLGKNIDINTARKDVIEVLENGKALEKFSDFVKYQGGDINIINNPDMYHLTKHIVPVVAKKSGYIENMNTAKIGHISHLLGAGRLKETDIIDYGAGIIVLKKSGDYVSEGECIAYFHTCKDHYIDEVKSYYDAINISNERQINKSLIKKIIL